mgnify:CR=1 FL=1
MFVVVFGLLAGWRFLAGDPDHATVPQCALCCVRLDGRFDVSQQVVVLALQLPMIAGGAAEVEHELQRGENRYSRANDEARQQDMPRLQRPDDMARRDRHEAPDQRRAEERQPRRPVHRPAASRTAALHIREWYRGMLPRVQDADGSSPVLVVLTPAR